MHFRGCTSESAVLSRTDSSGKKILLISLEIDRHALPNVIEPIPLEKNVGWFSPGKPNLLGVTGLK